MNIADVAQHIHALEKKVKEQADEIKRLRVIIWNLLDDGDETDRAAARAALKEGE